MLIISVALSIPLTKTFNYFSPANNVRPVIGGRVQVPFGSRQIIGIVTAIYKYSNIPTDKLKPISKVLDKQSLFSDSLWRILNWAISYYHHPVGEILFHALPILLRQGKSAEIKPLWQWFVTKKGFNTLPSSLNRSPKQKKALEVLIQGPIFRHQVTKMLINNSSLQALRTKGLCDLRPRTIKVNNWYLTLNTNRNKLILNNEQINAVNSICNEESKFNVWLLAGNTGSGKTEVYLTVLENILSKGKQALILIPEINLMPQTIIRFRERFNVPIEVLHSKLNNSEKLEVWFKARRGECAIVIGTRSALFTPFTRLGIIIIDEEHDSSYKQSEGWRYHARNLAIFRAKEENISILLGSATPSLETLYNVQKKKYRQLILSKRAGAAYPVKHYLIDIKGLPLISGLSIPLLDKIRIHLKSGNQVMIFLNRRGFAPVLLCHECGWIAECKQCNHYYTIHQNKCRLRCHRCNNQYKLPCQCLNCSSTQLVSIGLGTEQLELALTSLFPGIPITRIDRDTTARKGDLENHLTKIKLGNAQILIGTQMLAKGHHFPDVTLVSLLDIDGVLFSSDFRAAEHFAQLYIQVSGRAGRANKKGEVLLQTHHPNHPLLQTLITYGYTDFAFQALQERYQAGLPPFTSHIIFLANDHDNCQAEIFLNQLRYLINSLSLKDKFLVIIGPIPALLHKRCGRFCWQLLLSHPSRVELQKIVSISLPLIKNITQARKVKWSLDVDPI